jgi:hypothetical protein
MLDALTVRAQCKNTFSAHGNSLLTSDKEMPLNVTKERAAAE